MLIYLKDIQYKFLKLILEFLYTRQCDVEEPELLEFFSVGKDLGVIGLPEYMKNYESQRYTFVINSVELVSTNI